MNDKKELGRKGEDLAASFLEKKGYRILDRNWTFGREEIDIIARDGNFIVVAEVKTRTSNALTEPESAVTKQKQRILIRAANAYVTFKRLNGDVRFDILSVIIRPEKEEINHIMDAFYATMR